MTAADIMKMQREARVALLVLYHLSKRHYFKDKLYELMASANVAQVEVMSALSAMKAIGLVSRVPTHKWCWQITDSGRLWLDGFALMFEEIEAMAK